MAARTCSARPAELVAGKRRPRNTDGQLLARDQHCWATDDRLLRRFDQADRSAVHRG